MPRMTRTTKFIVAAPGRHQVAELLADLALDRQRRDRRTGDAELEERRARREAGAHRPVARPVGRLAADDEGRRAHARDRRIGRGDRQVRLLEVVPAAGQVTGRRVGDGPVGVLDCGTPSASKPPMDVDGAAGEEADGVAARLGQRRLGAATAQPSGSPTSFVAGSRSAELEPEDAAHGAFGALAADEVDEVADARCHAVGARLGQGQALEGLPGQEPTARAGLVDPGDVHAVRGLAIRATAAQQHEAAGARHDGRAAERLRAASAGRSRSLPSASSQPVSWPSSTTPL